jgi:hypothetical protein
LDVPSQPNARKLISTASTDMIDLEKLVARR